jgi:DnaJ family protein C protein 2
MKRENRPMDLTVTRNTSTKHPHHPTQTDAQLEAAANRRVAALKASESSASLAKAASSTSLGSLADDPDAQENDPTYAGPKDPIKIGPKGKEFLDHYHIMGLGRERFNATLDQINANFKVRSLLLHPDKCGIAQASEEDKEKLEKRFKDLQTAFEVLTDSKKRREYDSVDAPKTKLPKKLKEDGSEWFEKCVPAFKELARFYDGKGDASRYIVEDPEAPFEKVREMYAFWAKFKSWREFPAEDEEDLESADDRWQRREMEKENKKKREEEKKADTKRIKQFIGLAEDTDPRVIAKRREEKEAREAKKLAKGAGRREAEAEAAKAAEEAAAKAAEEAEKAKVEKAAAKKELEKQKKALRKEKARLRENAARAAGADGYPGEDKVEDLCGALDFDGIKKLNDALDAITDGAGIVAAVNQALADAGKA